MSASSKEEPPIDRPSADALLCSTDGVLFAFHMHSIFRACPRIIQYCVQHPRRPGQLAEFSVRFNARTLHLLFKFIDIPSTHILDDISLPLMMREDTLALVIVACELGMTVALEKARDALLCRSSRYRDSGWAYEIAYHYQLWDVCRAVAFDSLRGPLLEDRAVRNPTLKSLYEYQQACREIVLIKLSPKRRSLYDSDSSLFNCQCDGQDEDTRVRPYWNLYDDQAIDLLLETPYAEVLSSPRLIANALDKASYCDSCARHAASRFQKNVAKLKADCEALIRSVTLHVPPNQ